MTEQHKAVCPPSKLPADIRDMSTIVKQCAGAARTAMDQLYRRLFDALDCDEIRLAGCNDAVSGLQLPYVVSVPGGTRQAFAVFRKDEKMYIDVEGEEEPIWRISLDSLYTLYETLIRKFLWEDHWANDGFGPRWVVAINQADVEKEVRHGT